MLIYLRKYNINEGVLHKVKEGMNVLHTVIKRKAKWMDLTFKGPNNDKTRQHNNVYIIVIKTSN